MTTKPLRKYVSVDSSWEAPDASTLADDAWILLVPTHFADAETLDIMGKAPGPTDGDFERDLYTVDRKLTRDDDVRFGHTNPVVSEDFVAALLAFGVAAWRTTPLPHASPNAVGGRAVYLLDSLGPHLTIDASTAMNPPAFAPKCPGRAGFPSLPLVFDGAGWTGDAVGLTEPCASFFNRPWRGLAVRGDFVRAFERLHGRKVRCAWEPAAMVNAPTARVAAPAPLHTSAAAPASAAPTVDELIARITSEAAQADHQLPSAPASVAALDAVASAFGGVWPASLKRLLSEWNGASLRGGAIGFFALTERAGDSELAGRHAHFGVPDTLDGAQRRDGEAEWNLARPDGALLFGWRAEEMPAIWCVDREGLVRLLEQGRTVLGPAVTVEAWLRDQLDDLAYAATGAWPASKWLGE